MDESLRSDRIPLPAAEPRCEPSRGCTARTKCARALAVIPQGGTLGDWSAARAPAAAGLVSTLPLGQATARVSPRRTTAAEREHMARVKRMRCVLCAAAEDGAKDAQSIATRFLDEMDWTSDALTIQFERCDPVLRARAMIRQNSRVAA